MKIFTGNKFGIILLLFPLFISAIKSQTTPVIPDPEIQEMIKELSAEYIEKNIRTLTGFGTRNTFSAAGNDTFGIGAAASWVKSEFEKYAEESNGRLQVAYDSFEVEPDKRRIPRKATLKNILATLKGTDPNDNRIFIAGAHLDSRASDVMDSVISAPGANDDASGIAVIMELARVMSKREFPSTIIFAAFVGEEQGLLGSDHLAKKAKDNSWNVAAMFNNDMVGNSSSGGTLLKDNMQLRIFSEGVPAYETEEMALIRRYTSGENDSESRQLARYVKEVGEYYVDQINVTLIYRSDRFLRGGDHLSFNRHGYPAVRFCEMNENYNHQHQDVRIENGIQYGDLPEFIDYEYARKIACVNLAALASLALAPASPQNVGIDTSVLTNFSRLLWEPPEGKSPAGYYVLMRETYQPLWQKKFFVKGTEITLPYSKDNYFFAVQSVDEEGHASLPVFPYPIR